MATDGHNSRGHLAPWKRAAIAALWPGSCLLMGILAATFSG
jgi:hypothetical protein